MKVIEFERDSLQLKYLITTHRLIGFKNIVVSNKKIYQLPCMIGKRSYDLKEIKPKYHMCMIHYIIESKRYSIKQLKKLIVRFDDKILIEKTPLYPF